MLALPLSALAFSSKHNSQHIFLDNAEKRDLTKCIFSNNSFILLHRKHPSQMLTFLNCTLWTAHSKVQILHITERHFDVEDYKSLFHSLFFIIWPDFWLQLIHRWSVIQTLPPHTANQTLHSITSFHTSWQCHAVAHHFHVADFNSLYSRGFYQDCVSSHLWVTLQLNSSALCRGASCFLRFTNCLNEFCHHSTQLINADTDF